MKRTIIISLLLTPLLWVIARINYLVFHTLIEMLAVITGASLSIFALSVPKSSRPYFLNHLAITYLNVIIVDFLHTLAYKGMGVFPHFSANQPTQFWILGRTLETLGLSSILFKRLNWAILLLILSSANLLGIYSIFSGSFPLCFIEGKGLTHFKVLMEYLMIAVLTLLFLFMRRSKEPYIIAYKEPLSFAFLFTSLAEASFTLYTDVYGFFNALGHLFRFLSYLVILVGIIKISITEPLKTLYKNLELELSKWKSTAVKDPLTGVYNRNFFEEKVKDTVFRLIKEKVPVVIAMADIDNFKSINDRYSHLVGDEVLKRVGETLRNSLRAGDIVVRFGGDEFLIFLVDCDESHALKILERLERTISALSSEFGFPVSLSIGYIEASKLRDSSVDKLIEIADKRMYEKKTKSKV